MKYSNLFEINPLPTWVYEVDSFRIIDVNGSAVDHYGFSKKEFLSKTILDLSPEEEIEVVRKAHDLLRNHLDSLSMGVFTHFKKNEEPIRVEVYGYRLNHSNRECFMVVCKDITLQEKGNQTNQQTQNILDESLDIIGSIDNEGKFIWLSAATLAHWGYSPEELIGTPYIDLVHPEDIEITNQAAANIISGENLTTFENRYIKKNGEIAFNLWSARWDAESKIMYTIARDGKEKKQKEEILIESESRFKALVQEGSDIIGILDEKNIYKYVSPTSTSILGILPEELVGHSPFEFIHPDDEEKVLKSLSEIVTRDRVQIEPFRFQNKKGEWCWIETVLTNLMNHSSINGIVANSRDITLIKEEENRLKLLESVVKNARDSVIIMEVEPLKESVQKILYVNPAFTKMTGYSSKEVIGKSPEFLQGPKPDRAEIEKLNTSMEKWESCEISIRNYRKNGEEFWINLRVNPVPSDRGVSNQWIAIVKDVTIEKNEEIQRELLSLINEELKSGTNLFNSLEGLCKLIVNFDNFSFCEIWLPSIPKDKIRLYSKYAKDEEAALFYEHSNSIRELYSGEGLPGMVWEKSNIEILDNLAENKKFERSLSAERSGIKSVIGIPLIYENSVVGVMVIGSNENKSDFFRSNHIFEKLQKFIGSEISRKKLEDDLIKLFEALPNLVGAYDFQGNILKMNKAGCDLLEYDENELVGKPLYNFIHPDDAHITEKKIEKLNGGGTVFNFENRYITKSGKVIWLNWQCSSNENDEVVFSTATNITNEKKLKELINMASQLSVIGAWEIDMNNNLLTWSDIVHQIHETDRKEFTPELNKAINFYKPEYREVVKEKIEEAQRLGSSFDFEALLITAKGKEKWVRAIGQAETIEGKCIRIFGSIQDIDEKKKSSDELERAYLEKDQILESIGDAFFAVDNDWIVTYWNRVAEEILPKKRDEIVGKNLWKVYNDVIDTTFYDKYHEAKRTGKVIAFEELYTTLNIWLEVTVYPSKGGLSVYFKDITNRKKADLKILQANERFEKIAQTTSDAIWDWDIENNTFYRGGGFSELFGYEENKMHQQSDFWKDLLHPEDLPRIQESLQSTLNNPNIDYWKMEYRIVSSNNDIRKVIEKGMIIRNSLGQAVRMVGAITDITESKKYELELQNLNKQLRKYTTELELTNEQLEQFAYIASHDLQEPLRMISSFLTQLQRKYSDHLDDKALKYISYATDGAKRMKQIILDLLEYSRAGKIDHEPEEISLNQLFDEYILLRRKVIEENSVNLIINDLPDVVGQKTPLIQTIHGLVDNAIKYRKPNKAPNIEVTVTDDDDFWIFRIKDNGIGIDRQFFDKIFVIFQRLHNRNDYEGTGIGLSVAKKNIESWGGRIWVESTVDIGSTFYFTIPKSKQN